MFESVTNIAKYQIVLRMQQLPVVGWEVPTAVSGNVPYTPLDIPIMYKFYL